MEQAEFDKFAAEYRAMHQQNIAITGEQPEYFAEYKIRDMREIVGPAGEVTEPLSILDFGGGVGASAPFLRRHFPQSEIIIADVSKRSLDIAEQRGIERLRCLHFDGTRLPLDDGSQDLALAACVFHHVPEERHIGLLRDIRRVLAPGGRLFVFEHNPWNPLTRHAVDTCPFDENAVLISAPTMKRRLRAAGFADADLTVRYRIFFPHALASLRPLERLMVALPLGAQYSACARKSS